MKNFNSNTKNSDEWLTPPEIIKALGDFDMDPCTLAKMPWSTANVMLCKERDGDGLSAPWYGRVWCNPPYGKETFKWLDKLSKHPQKGIALIFARTDTVGFHKTVLSKADAIFFFQGRLKFYKPDGTQGGTANAPSCLVSYSRFDTRSIEQAIAHEKIKGHIVYLK